MHLPHGIITVAFVYLSPVLALCWCAGFMVYELNQDWHTKDEAHCDIFGYLVGMVIGGICAIILRNCLI